MEGVIERNAEKFTNKYKSYKQIFLYEYGYVKNGLKFNTLISLLFRSGNC